MDLALEEHEASQGGGSPEKRQRVMIPDISEKPCRTSVHGATLMGKFNRQCLSKAIRSADDLAHLRQGILAISIIQDDGS